MTSNNSKKRHSGKGHERRLSIRDERRREPDYNTIAKTVIALAMAQAEKEAQEAAQRTEEARDAS